MGLVLRQSKKKQQRCVRRRIWILELLQWVLNVSTSDASFEKCADIFASPLCAFRAARFAEGCTLYTCQLRKTCCQLYSVRAVLLVLDIADLGSSTEEASRINRVSNTQVLAKKSVPPYGIHGSLCRASVFIRIEGALSASMLVIGYNQKG